MAQPPKTSQGGGFTVEQGAATIHEDSAAFTVSTSSLTMEVEAVTHALRWTASRGDSQTTHAILLTDSMSLTATKSEKWNGTPRLECVDGRYPPSKPHVGVLLSTCRSERK